ncbi:MAG: hypothetical protein IT532_00850 [Burkholderiales bacterium]|nr:hypothetical protein [Burkholderiales bacterium]
MPACIAIRFLALLGCVCVALPALAARLDGDYQQVGTSLFEKLSFRSGGKVYVTFMGMTKVGTYEVDGKEVLITVGNETNVFTLDDKGCVVGGGPLGTYCKGGGSAAAAKPGTPAGTKPGATAAFGSSKGAALSGKYKAGDAKVNVVLDFRPASKVRILVAGSQTPSDARDATYKVVGDKVTVSDPDGGAPLVLTRKGNVLEGAPEGEAMKMKFVRQ